MVAGVLEFCGEPALRVFDVDFADLAEFAFRHHLAGLFDGREAGVGVGQGEDQSGLLDFGLEFDGLVEGEGDGFVDDHVESAFEGHHGGGVMGEIGSDDGDEVHPLAFRQAAFVFKHLLIGFVNPVVGQVIGFAGGNGNFRIDAEAAADEFDLAVHEGGEAVDGSDEGVAAAADHAHA